MTRVREIACLQGLARFSDDTGAEADYIVVELARRLLGEDWLPQFVKKANAGGIETGAALANA